MRARITRGSPPLRLLLSVVVLGSVLALAPAEPAHAALGNGTCDAGEVCVWEDDGYKGCFNDFKPYNADMDYLNGNPDWNNCTASAVINDKISSYKNRSSHWVVFWEHSGARGVDLCGKPGASSPNLNNFGSYTSRSIEDRISSHETFSGDPEGGPRIICTYKDSD